MKLTASAILISAALAAIATAAPVANPSHRKSIDVNLPSGFTKRCMDCTSKDATALDLIVKASAGHYADIAKVRLDALVNEIATAKVTSGNQDLPKEKALLNLVVKATIDKAKKDCSSEALAPVIKATVVANSNLDIPWSKEEEVKKKIIELDIVITKTILDRIQANINAELLSKDCTEKMTNTQITPVPETAQPTQPTSETPPAIGEVPLGTGPESPVTPPAEIPVTPESPAPVDPSAQPDPIREEVPSPPTGNQNPTGESTPVTQDPASEPCTEWSEPPRQRHRNKEDKPLKKEGIDVPSKVDTKFVCATGCKDTKEANV
ncbi:hypothetical protein BGW38_001520, partial [Lunasporangiospora selenospora]